MTALLPLLDEYLATRRAFGARLLGDERMLRNFLAFLGQRQDACITTQLALQWATEPCRTQPAYQARRLGVVRAFARYAHAADPRHEVPPHGLLPAQPRRATPYIYSDKEIADLADAAKQLRGSTPLRAATHSTLLALLAVTGMRSCEPLRLDRDDVDFGSGVLTVRNTKFGKSRYLPIHASTCQALQAYALLRDKICPLPATPAFFLSDCGTRITQGNFERIFRKLSQQVGLRDPSASRGPRLHDLRHSFAVCTLLRWYREGLDVEQRLPRLATYLGHVQVSDTYWYLTATPELLQLAARRLDHNARRLPA